MPAKHPVLMATTKILFQESVRSAPPDVSLALLLGLPAVRPAQLNTSRLLLTSARVAIHSATSALALVILPVRPVLQVNTPFKTPPLSVLVPATITPLITS